MGADLREEAWWTAGCLTAGSVASDNDSVMRKSNPHIVRTPEQGRELAARRRLKNRICLECGRQFSTVGRGLYCSHPCREAYFRRCRKSGVLLPSVERQRAKRHNDSVVTQAR